MADGIAATPGTGVVIASRDTGTVEWPANVLGFLASGSDGSWVVQDVDATHGLPVAVVGSIAVTGTFYQATQPISAASLPLPSGAATAANQTTELASLASIDGKITASDTDNVTVVSSALPSGAATSAKQDTGNTSLASIDTKTPALGQALAAASVPIVLTAAQLSTLTPPAAITGFATETTLGTLSAKFASGTVIGDVNLGATDNAVLDAIAASVAGTLTVGSHAVTNAGTFAVQAAQSGTWNVTNISGTVSLPTGAATEAKQPALGTAGTASADVLTIQGIASMTPILVDGSGVTQPVSGTFWQATQPVSLASAVAVTDNSGSLTVDAPVGTPVFVRLSDGSSAIGTLPVSLASVPSHAVTNAGTFVVQVDGTALTRLTDIETNTDSGAVVGNGAAATAQRVTLANDSTGIVALTTSTASIGKLAANSGVDIGDVDVASIAAGDNNIGNVDIVTVPADPFGANADAASATGSISAKLRFIAATGIPVTGTVAVTQSGTWDEIGINDSGNSITVDYATTGSGTATGALRVELPTNGTGVIAAVTAITNALPAGSNAIGKLAANSGVDIGDVDVTSQPARAATTDTITAKLATDTIQNGTTALTPKFATIAASSSGNNTLVSAVNPKKIRVLAYNLIGNGAVNAKFQSGASGTDLTGLKYIAAAGGGICAPFNPVGWFETASNTLLNLNLSGAVAVGGELVYVEV